MDNPTATSPKRRPGRKATPPVRLIEVPSLVDITANNKKRCHRRRNPVLILCVMLAYLLFGILLCVALLFPSASSMDWKKSMKEHFDWVVMGMTRSTTPAASASAIATTPLEQCGFQTYRHPFHHEGLPRLVEVFHTDDSVYFGALNEGVCEPEWRIAQNFSSQNTFLCEYEDGTYVRSDPLPPSTPNDDVWTKSIIVIRCPLPSHLQSQSMMTNDRMRDVFTVSLHATVDLEAERKEGIDPDRGEAEWKYSSAAMLGRYQDLLVCPREWPNTASALARASSSNSKKTVYQTQQEDRVIRGTLMQKERSTTSKNRTLSMVTDPNGIRDL